MSPKTPQRTIRIPDELWDAVKAKATANGKTVTDVTIEAYRRYLRSMRG
jgi:predicted DNA binding CopG/RHH family protein